MGLFGRKKKLDQRPVAGRDDLVAISEKDIYKIAMPYVKEITESVESEIPDQIVLLFQFGTMLMGQAHGWNVSEAGQMLSQSAARYGFVARKVEILRTNGALMPDKTGILLDLYEKQEMPPGEPGFVRSINTAIGACNLPVDAELELNPDLDVVFPGWPTAVRQVIGQAFITGFTRQAELDGEQAPKPSQLLDSIFYGYMIHVWSELEPDNWLEGIDEFL